MHIIVNGNRFDLPHPSLPRTEAQAALRAAGIEFADVLRPDGTPAGEVVFADECRAGHYRTNYDNWPNGLEWVTHPAPADGFFVSFRDFVTRRWRSCADWYPSATSAGRALSLLAGQDDRSGEFAERLASGELICLDEGDLRRPCYRAAPCAAGERPGAI